MIVYEGYDDQTLAALQATTDTTQTITNAGTANFLADIQHARETFVVDRIAQLPAEHRAAAKPWLDLYGILPPWYERMLPERAWEPGS